MKENISKGLYWAINGYKIWYEFVDQGPRSRGRYAKGYKRKGYAEYIAKKVYGQFGDRVKIIISKNNPWPIKHAC